MTAPVNIIFTNHDELREIIGQLKGSDRKSLHVTVDIPAQHSMMCDVALESGLSDAEIMQFLKSRAPHLFGYAADQLRIDYKIQPHHADEKQKITAIAAHDALISHIENLFQSEKIKIDAICVNQKMNLMQWREKQKYARLKKIFLGALFFSIFVFAFFIIMKFFLMHETRLLKIETKKIISHSEKIVSDNPHQHIALLQKLIATRAQKIISTKSNKTIEILLADIANDLPSDVTLTSLTLDSKKIKLVGEGDQLTSIHQYANALMQTLIGKKVQLAEINNSAKNKLQMNFTIVVTL